MNSNIFKAIAWKEARQISGFLLSFTIIIIISLYYDRSDSHKATVPLFCYTSLSFMLLNLVLAILLGAGFHIIERSNFCDDFLVTKPLKKLWIYWSNYLSGIIIWIGWSVFTFLIILVPTIPAAKFAEFTLEYLRMFSTIFIFYYSAMFSISILIPSLPVNLLSLVVLTTGLVMDARVYRFDNIYTEAICVPLIFILISYIVYTKPRLFHQ